jgi:photosystem II stability/assembly factor-like uncharacterized protein
MTVRRLFPALVLVAVLLAACSGKAPNPHATGPTSTTTTLVVPTTTTPVTKPVTTTAGNVVEDLTWISPTHGWALADDEHCGQATCTEVLTTTNGGSAWSPVGSIAAPSGNCSGCGLVGVSHIRFANNLDGYAFGPQLYVTTDGGVTWTQQSGPYVTALEPAGTNVMRVSFTHTGCPGPCDLTVQSAPAGSSAWQSLTAPFQGDAVQLVRQGSEAYVAVYGNPAGGGDARTTLMLSQDGGTTWGQRADPCDNVGGDEFDTVAINAAPQSVLVALCRDRFQSQRAYVAVSTDSGVVFAGQSVVSVPAFLGSIAATNASTIFLGTAGSPGTGSTQWVLLASTDGGHSWQTAVSETGQAQLFFPTEPFLGFENTTVGRWVGEPYHLWETTDGGVHWIKPAIGT